MIRIIALLVVVSGFLLGATRMGMAQEATPAGGVVPDPAECQVDPRPLEEVTALWAGAATPEPNTGIGTPDAHATPFTDLPTGEPADAATTEAVTATVRQFIACINGGDFLRVLSLYSDNLVATLGSESDATLAQLEIQLAAPPRPFAEEDWSTLVALTNVVGLDDGRVAAVVITIDALTDSTEEETSLFYFVEQDGRWLIDGLIADISLDPVASPSA